MQTGSGSAQAQHRDLQTEMQGLADGTDTGQVTLRTVLEGGAGRPPRPWATLTCVEQEGQEVEGHPGHGRRSFCELCTEAAQLDWPLQVSVLSSPLAARKGRSMNANLLLPAHPVSQLLAEP